MLNKDILIGIRPQAGLANRMRVLDSALSLANALHRNLIVYWVKTPDFNCSYNQLFKSTSSFKLIESRSFIRDNGRIQKLQISILNFLGLKFPRGYQQYLFHENVVRNIQLGYSFLNLPSHSIYFQTDTRFMKTEKALTAFEPCEDVQRRVNDFMSSHLKSRFVGLHIRRADHVKAILQSPTSLFIQSIREEINSNPESIFFLSTDSVTEEYTLKKLFGDRIICRGKVLSRAKPIGIQDAFIDMLLLAKSTKIYGSYYSSFSEVAASIGNIPLITLNLAPS
jgi:hypothetical protein